MNISYAEVINFVISILLVHYFTRNLTSANEPGCTIVGRTKYHPALDRLKTLSGKRYSITDDSQRFTYNVGICADAEPYSTPNIHAGIVQRDLKNPSTAVVVVGKFTSATFMAGTNWMLLEYLGGQNYSNMCGNQPRRGSIMFLCDPNETEGALHIVEENQGVGSECYFLFELTHASVCGGYSASSPGLSAGSVFVIVLASVVGVYLVGGFLYRRFVAGAKGWEQLPNHAFWQDFGNLLADGCELVCRRGHTTRMASTPASREYKGLGDDQLQDDEYDRDEHLLPM